MNAWFARARLAAIVVWTLPLFGLFLLMRLAPPSRGAAWSIVRFWAKGVARLLGMRIVVEGAPPRPPFLLVSNHLGYVDIVAYLATLDATFLSKIEVGAWPFVGMLARGVGTLFIDRERRRDLPRVASDIECTLASGRGVIVFPEGTSSGGDAVLPFRPATFEAAARLRVPVAVACLEPETGPGEPHAREAVCWWGDMEFAPHVVALAKLAGRGGFTTRIRFGAAPLGPADRKTLSERAHAAVVALHAPRTTETEPAVEDARTLAVLGESLASALEQAIVLIDSIDEEAFGAAEPALSLSSVGAHLRHVGDAAERLLDASGSKVDYDLRQRDVLLEIDPEAARARFVRLAERARSIAPSGAPIAVNIDSPLADRPLFSRSSIGRELQFVASHAVHHFALVALRLRLLGVPVPHGFGVAPSTLKHIESLRRCAR